MGNMPNARARTSRRAVSHSTFSLQPFFEPSRPPGERRARLAMQRPGATPLPGKIISLRAKTVPAKAQTTSLGAYAVPAQAQAISARAGAASAWAKTILAWAGVVPAWAKIISARAKTIFLGVRRPFTSPCSACVRVDHLPPWA
ncbi:MAG: hypothetical protein MUE97_06445 [Phycisphaerales bacterium]|jgi:hypothetical protein|nr:hypothetical protein [Phycisphaerales bacterium]